MLADFQLFFCFRTQKPPQSSLPGYWIISETRKEYFSTSGVKNKSWATTKQLQIKQQFNLSVTQPIYFSINISDKVLIIDYCH